jgi:hypothetical protein
MSGGAPASGMIIADTEALARLRSEREAALATALTAGSPTRHVRTEIAELDEQIRQNAMATADRTAAEQSEYLHDVDEVALRLAERAIEELTEQLAGLAPPSIPACVSLETEATIQAASLRIAHARAELGAARGRLGQAAADAQTLRDQILQKQTQRALMIERRQNGRPARDDATFAADIILDVEGLEILVQGADEKWSRLRPFVAHAQQALALAEQDMQRVMTGAMLDLLTGHLRSIGALMANVIEQHQNALIKVGARPNWDPGTRLYLGVRKAAAAFGRL